VNDEFTIDTLTAVPVDWCCIINERSERVFIDENAQASIVAAKPASADRKEGALFVKFRLTAKFLNIKVPVVPRTKLYPKSS
jgi:hypothetical protein